VDERLKFVARLLEGEKMAVLCREFDISHKTGHKIFNRYKDCGLEGLTDRSRRPYRQANRLPFQVEDLILQLKREHPSWGAPKIREKLRRRHTEMTLPAISTVHAILDRHGLVTRGRNPRYKAQGTTLTSPMAANDLWCADYKGEFMLADKKAKWASGSVKELERAHGPRSITPSSARPLSKLDRGVALVLPLRATSAVGAHYDRRCRGVAPCI
jgi:putative transposase